MTNRNLNIEKERVFVIPQTITTETVIIKIVLDIPNRIDTISTWGISLFTFHTDILNMRNSVIEYIKYAMYGFRPIIKRKYRKRTDINDVILMYREFFFTCAVAWTAINAVIFNNPKRAPTKLI